MERLVLFSYYLRKLLVTRVFHTPCSLILLTVPLRVMRVHVTERRLPRFSPSAKLCFQTARSSTGWDFQALYPQLGSTMKLATRLSITFSCMVRYLRCRCYKHVLTDNIIFRWY
jgi:hypothetical protein